MSLVDRVYRRVSDHLRVLSIRDFHAREQVLETTNDHPFMVPGVGRVDAGQLQVGDLLYPPLGPVCQVVATRHEEHPEGVEVFNLRIAGTHTYFVRQQGVDAEPVWVHNAEYPIGDSPSARFVHDQYVQQVRPGAIETPFETPWSEGMGLGSRRFDDFDWSTGTGFEGNTTPWEEMTAEQLSRKLGQVGSDFALLKTDSGVNRVIWFGTEPLPTTGLGAQLREALQKCNIPYWVVKP